MSGQDVLGSIMLTVSREQNPTAESAGASPLGYDIVSGLLGKRVRIYVYNGASLTGILECIRGKFIRVVDRDTNREATINLDHVASITTLS